MHVSDHNVGGGWKEVARSTLVIDPNVRVLCKKTYPNHPKGCPNFGKRSHCPPKAALLTDVLDLDQPLTLVWNIFDLGAHRERMRQAHPEWTERQLVNCLYWQGSARKALRERAKEFLKTTASPTGKRRYPLYCPEACGLNITATMKAIGEELQWPPVSRTYQVALVGYVSKRDFEKPRSLPRQRG